MRTERFAGLAALALLLAATPAQPEEAGTLYKWRDAQGQVHYSDKPPADPATPVETHALPKQDPSDQNPIEQGPGADYYSVENQARRLEEDRLQREAQRRDQERQRQAEQARAAETQANQDRAAAEEDGSEYDDYPAYVRPFRPLVRPSARPPYSPIQRPLRPRPVPLPANIGGAGRR